MEILRGEFRLVPLTVVRIESGDYCIINSNSNKIWMMADELDDSSWRLLLDSKFAA